MWVGGANDLTQATETMETLSEQNGLEYFIPDFRTGSVVASSRKKGPSGSNSPASREGT